MLCEVCACFTRAWTASFCCKCFQPFRFGCALQELNIEKQLEKIDSTWSGLYLSFSQYQDTDVFQMNADDLITEALETDNLTLQNMSAGKYVQVCPIRTYGIQARSTAALVSLNECFCTSIWPFLRHRCMAGCAWVVAGYEHHATAG